jgi:hypothetical protein
MAHLSKKALLKHFGKINEQMDNRYGRVGEVDLSSRPDLYENIDPRWLSKNQPPPLTAEAIHARAYSSRDASKAVSKKSPPIWFHISAATVLVGMLLVLVCMLHWFDENLIVGAGQIGWSVTLLSMVLQLWLISVLLREWRTYTFLLVLLVLELFTAVTAVAATLGSHWTDNTARIYLTMEVVNYTLIYAAVVQLLVQTLKVRYVLRWTMCVLLIGVIVAALSTLTSDHSGLRYWMTKLLQHLSLGSTFVNVVLWAMLIRRKDCRSVMMLTCGLGIQSAGNLIGLSLRLASPELVGAGNVILSSVYLVFLIALCWAFSNPGQANRNNVYALWVERSWRQLSTLFSSDGVSNTARKGQDYPQANVFRR